MYGLVAVAVFNGCCDKKAVMRTTGDQDIITVALLHQDQCLAKSRHVAENHARGSKSVEIGNSHPTLERDAMILQYP